jgi:hypothetical protein
MVSLFIPASTCVIMITTGCWSYLSGIIDLKRAHCKTKAWRQRRVYDKKRYNYDMRGMRPTTIIIRFLIALLVVLLIGFLPLRDFFVPAPAVEIGAVPDTPSPPATRTPASTQPATATTAPTAPGPRIEQADPLFIANSSDSAILRIDPYNNEVTGRVTLEGSIDAIAADQGGVWIAITTGRYNVSILRLDPHDLSIQASIPIYNGWVRCLEAGTNAVWAGIDSSLLDGNSSGKLLRIDPSQNEISGVIERPAVPHSMASYAQTLWLLGEQDGRGTVARMDTTSRQLIELHNLSDGVHFSYQHLSIGAAGTWVTAIEGEYSYLIQFHPSSGSVIQTFPLGDTRSERPTALLVGDRFVWVALQNGRLMQVDPQLQDEVWQIQIPPGLDKKIRLQAESLWVENGDEAEVYRIDPAQGELLAVLSTGSKPAPTPQPSPTLSPGMEPECDAHYATRLIKGGKAIVKLEPPLPNRLRSEPDRRAEILGQIEPGEMINLIDGPVCQNGWIWWYVQSRQSGLRGWTSEGDRNEYWLSPLE